MGLNLMLVRAPAGPARPHWSVIETAWWDCDKYVGDVQFEAWHMGDGRAVHEQEPSTYGDGSVYWRPADFGLSRQWVATELRPPHMRQRFFTLLEQLQANDDFWLYSSV